MACLCVFSVFFALDVNIFLASSFTKGILICSFLVVMRCDLKRYVILGSLIQRFIGDFLDYFPSLR